MPPDVPLIPLASNSAWMRATPCCKALKQRRSRNNGVIASITFCQELGLDYVSCSPYRVPVARLAAAQAALGVESDRTA